MKRILVAGAAGFLGVAVCEVLAGKYEVRGIDLNSRNVLLGAFWHFSTIIFYDIIFYTIQYPYRGLL